jgi:tripartite-type tricarboxylate transporter receptor subunit TctC
LKNGIQLGVCLALLLSIQSAWSADYPVKPVRFVVPYPSGGPTDTTARLYGEKVGKALGQPLVVDNRPGAAGVIGMQAALAAPADGYTLYFGTLGTQVITPVINTYRGIANPVDVRKELVPTALLATIPIVLVVNPQVPANNVREFIDYAKANPGKLNYGSDGIGSLTHLGTEMLNQITGISTTHVPYKGLADQTNALLSGDLQFVFSGILNPLGFQKQGRLKILASATPARAAILPNVPTMIESGVPGFDLTTWFGVFFRAGTDRAVINIVSQEVQKAAKLPDVMEKMSVQGMEASSASAEQFANVMDSDWKRWSEVLRKSNLKFE